MLTSIHVFYSFIIFCLPLCFSLFFFNDTATTEIYTLSLHDALPISSIDSQLRSGIFSFAISSTCFAVTVPTFVLFGSDRKSTRLNSSHQIISYAVFCLKKKKKQQRSRTIFPV